MENIFVSQSPSQPPLNLFSDRCVTEQGAEQVEKIQYRLVEALEQMLHMNHPDDPHLIAKLILIMTELRPLALAHTKELSDILTTYNIPVPPAVFEAIISQQ